MSQARRYVVRVVALLTAILGVNYVAWRWLFSVSWDDWWIAVPLVLAETYSLVDSLLFGMTVWRLKGRGEPPVPAPDLTVDVFIATYNEPLDLVLGTARAAQRITYPHRTWILDDGNRAELRARAEAEGIGWITRSADWAGMPRHAKAGNLNNALLATEGEFLLILDADMVPEPDILDRTLGYFSDERMALVQTPQYFVNVPADDPLGSQAPLFYGPIQEGKDGWNAAFFCGSNAVIRREALMQLGVSRYAGEVEVGVHRALRTARSVVRKARRSLAADEVEVLAALDRILYDIARARRELQRGEALFDVTYRFQQRVADTRRELVGADLRTLHEDLAIIAGLESLSQDPEQSLATIDEAALLQLADREWSPLGAVETVRGAGALHRRRPRRRGAAGDADGHHLGHRGHGDLHAAARPRVALGLPRRGARQRPRARGPADDAHPAAALGAGHRAGDVPREPAGPEGADAGAAAHVLRDHVELPVRLRGPGLHRRPGHLPHPRRAAGVGAEHRVLRAPGALPARQPAAVLRGRRRPPDLARAAVLPGPLPRLDPVVHLGLRQRLPGPLAGLRGHAEGEAARSPGTGGTW